MTGAHLAVRGGAEAQPRLPGSAACPAAAWSCTAAFPLLAQPCPHPQGHPCPCRWCRTASCQQPPAQPQTLNAGVSSWPIRQVLLLTLLSSLLCQPTLRIALSIGLLQLQQPKDTSCLHPEVHSNASAQAPIKCVCIAKHDGGAVFCLGIVAHGQLGG